MKIEKGMTLQIQRLEETVEDGRGISIYTETEVKTCECGTDWSENLLNRIRNEIWFNSQ